MIDPQNPDFTNTPVSDARPVYRYSLQDLACPPAVSLITPHFNEGEVFAQTVASILQQSLQQWEWIIVDDASTDQEALNRLDQFTRNDPRIRCARLPRNAGPGAARNLGARMARAPFLAFIDSDDLFEPTTLEKWRWFLESHPQYSFVKGYQVGFDAETYLWREGFHSGATMLERNVVQTASMVRKEVWELVGGMDEEIRGGMEDWDFWLRCASHGYWGATVPEFLDWYRRRPSHSDRWHDWDASERQSEFRRRLKQRYPGIFDGGFPVVSQSFLPPYPTVNLDRPFANQLCNQNGKRILLIVPHLELGGSDKFTLDLIRLLTRDHGFEVTVAATLPGSHSWRHVYEKLTPDVFTLDSFLQLTDYPRFLAYLIESRNIDSVLVTHSQLGYQFLPFLRSQFPQLKCYDYIHIEEEQWKSGGYPRLSVNYQNFLDNTIASSDHLRQWIIERGADASKVKVCTTNIDPVQWNRAGFDIDAIRRKYSLSAGVPVISFIGRLCAQKQPDVLARTFLALRDRGVEFVALVAGDGELEPMLRGMVELNGLAEVRLLGSKANHEIREILAVSDIFFLPSKMEGISLAIFEAMAMEVVPVGADVGGQRELVTPETGILIRRGVDEPQEYAAAIAGLICDPCRRKSMGQAARERICAHFTLDRMGDLMSDILSSAASQPFNVEIAFRKSPSVLVTEVVEQRRLERVADELWATRITALRTAPHQSAPALPNDVFCRLLRDALSGNPFAWRKIRRGRSLTWSGLARSAALILRGENGVLRRRNLSLLRQVLDFDQTRGSLAAEFNTNFYMDTNPDVREAGVEPMLHYVFQGYREQRRPSDSFDPGQCLQTWPALRTNGLNPLLWKVWEEHAQNAD